MTVAAYSLSGDTLTVPANADLSASQYCGMTLNSSGKALLPSAAAPIVGVLQNDPDAADKAASIKVYGVTKAILGGTVAVADYLKVDSSGRFLLATAQNILDGAAVAICLVGGGINNTGTILLGTLGEGATLATQTLGDEVVSAAGAVSVVTDVTYLDITGTKAYTLADGLVGGQQKAIECVAVASTPLGTVTIDSPLSTEPATHVFTAVGQRLVLEWDSTDEVWRVIDKKRAGTQVVVVGTDVLTGLDMASTYALDIDGTVTSDQATEAIPTGQVAGESISVVPGTLENTPDGDINITGKNLDGVAVISIDTMDNATAHNAHFRWDGAAWQVTSFVGVTLETS